MKVPWLMVGVFRKYFSINRMVCVECTGYRVAPVESLCYCQLTKWIETVGRGTGGHTGGWVDPVASNADSKGHFQHDNNKYSLVIPFSITDRERSIPIIHSLELHATRLHSASVHLNRTMTRPYFRFIINWLGPMGIFFSRRRTQRNASSQPDSILNYISLNVKNLIMNFSCPEREKILNY